MLQVSERFKGASIMLTGAGLGMVAGGALVAHYVCNISPFMGASVGGIGFLALTTAVAINLLVNAGIKGVGAAAFFSYFSMRFAGYPLGIAASLNPPIVGGAVAGGFVGFLLFTRMNRLKYVS